MGVFNMWAFILSVFPARKSLKMIQEECNLWIMIQGQNG